MADERIAVIVEDDTATRVLLATALIEAGFRVVTAENGVDGIEAVRQNRPVVTTLDVAMTGMDAFEAVRVIRTFSSTYIVMLTAAGDEIDGMAGGDAGADDYLNKPVRPEELSSRLAAMLRRPRTMVPDAHAPVPAEIVDGFSPIISARRDAPED